MSTTNKAAYDYRGASHRVTPHSLSVIHSGEVHETYELDVIPEPVVYQIMYVSPSVLRTAASELAGRETTASPYFPELSLTDSRLVKLFAGLHGSLMGDAATLEQDSLLLFALADLIRRFAQNRPAPRANKTSRLAVRRAHDYLQDHYSENVSLAELSDVAGLSASHLCLLFRREFGVPPHMFQIQVRIDRAKHLLLDGLPPAQVALETGFTHQSHFGKHFKQLVGVTPAAYLK